MKPEFSIRLHINIPGNILQTEQFHKKVKRTTSEERKIFFRLRSLLLKYIEVLCRNGKRNSFCYNVTITLGKKVIVTFFVTLLEALERLLMAPKLLLTALEQILSLIHISEPTRPY